MNITDAMIETAAQVLSSEGADTEHGWLDAELIALSRTAMPALLTAVQNVLKLHRINQPEDGDCQGYTEIGYGYLSKWCVECSEQSGLYGTAWPCPTVAAIRDALGGAA